MQLLPTLAITAAVANQLSAVAQFAASKGAPRTLTLEAIFTYGSGGTSADAYVQTTFDGGATWVDIANFHFTTAAAKKIGNLSSLTPVTTLATPGDGALAANTVVDGLLGELLRVKWTSVGTYVGTTLQVLAVSNDRLLPLAL